MCLLLSICTDVGPSRRTDARGLGLCADQTGYQRLIASVVAGLSGTRRRRAEACTADCADRPNGLIAVDGAGRGVTLRATCSRPRGR